MPSREFHHSDVKRKIAGALLKGAIMVSPTRCMWDMSVNSQTGEVCDFPVSMIHFARPEADKGSKFVTLGTPEKQKTLEIEYRVQCADCQRERRRRRMFAKALNETKSAISFGKRSWRITLTCAPDYLYKRKCNAIMHCVERSISGETFAAGKMSVRAFKELDRQIYRDIQKYLKRLRNPVWEHRAPLSGVGPVQIVKHEGLRFTFLCVTEKTPDTRKDGTPNVNAGEPHYHLLVHEASASHPIRKREFRLRSNPLQKGDRPGTIRWDGGFVQLRLIDEASDPLLALYACKYLNKEGGRVRASKRYGSSVHADGSFGSDKSRPSKMERSDYSVSPSGVPGTPRAA